MYTTPLIYRPHVTPVITRSVPCELVVHMFGMVICDAKLDGSVVGEIAILFHKSNT